MYKKEAFQLGKAFELASSMLLPEDIFDTETDDAAESQDWNWFVPYIVNRAFACELFLKSLLSDGSNEVQGHSWSKLFYSLPAEKQEAIKNHPYFKGDEAFGKKLAEGSKVFTSWRYCFEHNNSCSVEIIFLDNFTEVIGGWAEKDISNM